MADVTVGTTFELSAPLGDALYSNCFYTVIGGNDITINFLCTKPVIGEELEAANGRNATLVKPVASIVLTHEQAQGLAAQLSQMVKALKGGS